MCGRFTLRTPLERIAEVFDLRGWETSRAQQAQLRFNIAPSQEVAAIRQDASERELAWLQWGLVPSWADDPAIGNRMINARGESLASKPAFREAFRRRRCLIVADGFFEWKKDGRAKQPHYIRMRDDSVFAFAGLWEPWRRGELALETCTVITTAANDLLRPLHERMPVILSPADYARWLDPDNTDPATLTGLLRAYPQELMTLNPVNSIVNSPRSDVPQCIEPARRLPTQGTLFD